jgi:hypothetical protein
LLKARFAIAFCETEGQFFGSDLSEFRGFRSGAQGALPLDCASIRAAKT